MFQRFAAGGMITNARAAGKYHTARHKQLPTYYPLRMNQNGPKFNHVSEDLVLQGSKANVMVFSHAPEGQLRFTLFYRIDFTIVRANIRNG